MKKILVGTFLMFFTISFSQKKPVQDTAIITNKTLPVVNDPLGVTYVEVTPNFKMRKMDQTSFPRFTQIVKNLKSYVQNTPSILPKLRTISGLTDAQILDKLTFGKGPNIELVQNLVHENQPVYGKFKHNQPEILYINQNFAQGLEQASLPTTIEATSFLLTVVVLHEFVHYGNFVSGFKPTGNEAGELFENAVYGIVVTKYNAYDVYVSLKNK